MFYMLKNVVSIFIICVCILSGLVMSDCLRLSWTIARQAPLSMEFSRQEYWSGLPFPSPGDRPYPGIKPTTLRLLHWQVDSLPLHHLGNPHVHSTFHLKLEQYRACRRYRERLELFLSTKNEHTLKCFYYWVLGKPSNALQNQITQMGQSLAYSSLIT